MSEQIKYPEITVTLVGEDGNAMAIISKVLAALNRSYVPQKEIAKFRKEVLSGDYNHLLQTVMKWVSVE